MFWFYELFYCLGSVGLGIIGLVLSYCFVWCYFFYISCLLVVGGIWFVLLLSYYLFLEVFMFYVVFVFLIVLFLYGIFIKFWLIDGCW